MSHGHEAEPYLQTKAVGSEIMCTLLRAVDTAEANTLRAMVEQHFDGVAIEGTDYLPRGADSERSISP